jgi:glycosyltransferase involved in cell wall biosynthesis
VTSADVPSGDGVHVYRNVKPHSPELLRLYAQADVFVLPTRADCFGVVLAEAMASSLPIVTTRVAAITEAVVDGVSGYVIEPDDGDALRHRLQQLAGDPDLRKRMGDHARRIGEESFDMRKNAGRIADILANVARQNRAGNGEIRLRSA